MAWNVTSRSAAKVIVIAADGFARLWDYSNDNIDEVCVLIAQANHFSLVYLVVTDRDVQAALYDGRGVHEVDEMCRLHHSFNDRDFVKESK